MMVLCQHKVCSPFSCRAYYHKCPAETKAMRRQNDAALKELENIKGYSCLVCHTGVSAVPGFVCGKCQAKFDKKEDLF